MKTEKIWLKFILDIIAVFVAVILAFMLNNWNENRRDAKAEAKILSEISNGLKKDIEDIKLNMQGHTQSIRACNFWRAVARGRTLNADTVKVYYSNLTRDYISIQNKSGYETLKSKGLEILKNDSLRFKIISLYEYDFTIIKKFEEEYAEMQFHSSYFKEINNLISPYLVYNNAGDIVNLNTPILFSEPEKKLLLAYLWKISMNRGFVLQFYKALEEKSEQLIADIDKELEN